MSAPGTSSSVSNFRAPFQPIATSTPRARRTFGKGKHADVSLQVPHAMRRSYLVNGSDLLSTRESYLKIALDIVRPGTDNARRTLSEEDEDEVIEELVLLDDALVGRYEGEDVVLGEAVYSMDVGRYQRLMDALSGRCKHLNEYLREPLLLPEWGPNDEPASQWTEPLFTLFAVLFREDVENFLSYCLHPQEVPYVGTPFRESRREKAKRQDAAVAAAITLMREGNKENVDPNRGGYSPQHRTLNEDRRPHNLPSPVPEEPEYEEAWDVRGLRESLADSRVNEHRGPTLEEEMPYRRRSRSSRLREIFEEPEYHDEEHYSGEWTPAREVAEWEEVGGHPARFDDGYRNPSTRGRGGFGGRRLRTSAPPATQWSQTPMPPPAAPATPWSRPPPPVRMPRPVLPGAPVFPQSRVSGVTSLATTPHFDIKMKPELIEEWDGNEDDLVDWIESVNVLAQRSPLAYEQLGQLVVTRFKGKAKNWWTSLSRAQRTHASLNWGNLKREVARYFMTRRWLDRGRIRAQNCRFRDSDAPNETPSEYFIRKSKLLATTEEYDDSLMIMSIMDGAPLQWQSIIDTSALRTPDQLQRKIQYHEDALQGRTEERNPEIRALTRRVRELEDRASRISGNSYPRRPAPPYVARTRKVTVEEVSEEEEEPTVEAETHLTGYTKELGKPAYPKDDSTVSKGRTPKDKGARGCRHCGSLMHWDSDCKYSRRNAPQVRAHLATISDPEEYWAAMDDYETVQSEDVDAAESLNC